MHAQSTDSWIKNNSVNYTNKAERVIFGCGGQESDKTLHEALARAFFNITSNLALLDSPNSKICMLAECSQGLGSEALLRYVTGRYTPGRKLDAVEYFDGLEVLTSFYKILGTVDTASSLHASEVLRGKIRLQTSVGCERRSLFNSPVGFKSQDTGSARRNFSPVHTSCRTTYL